MGLSWDATGDVDGWGWLEACGTTQVTAMEALQALSAQCVAQQETEARMSDTMCIAYREDGTLCRAPATILDHQRGGMVCLQHVPHNVAEEITLDLKMGTVEGRIDHDGEVYTWRLEEPGRAGLDWTTRAVAVLQEVQSCMGAGLLTHPLPGLVDDLRDRIAQLLREADVLDMYHCPTHGVRSRRRGEVRQAEVDEVCLYVCRACGQIADPTSFAGRTEDPRC